MVLTKLKNEEGITVVTLAVTIIVLIILASISVSTIVGDNGIIKKAEEAKKKQEIAEIKSEIKIEILAKKTRNVKDITQNEIEEILKEYGTVNKNEDNTIKSLTPTDKNYEISFEEIYNGEIRLIPIDAPEKSAQTAFVRSYGVIEIEFLDGTGYTTTITPNEPKMGNNMKKVYWEDDGTERVEGKEGFDEAKWYSYTAQTGDTTSGGTSKWANAVTVDSSGNITGYFVWIPRYAYRIVYFDTQEHEDAYRLTGATEGIVGYSDARGFVDTDGKTPSDMEIPVTSISVGTNKLRPHPAFEDGSTTGYTQGEWNTPLEGIWIAKYETSGTSTALKSLPGEKALVNTTIGDMYTYALNNDAEKNSHMIKNSEWGAMTYFADSKYGRNGTVVTQNTSGIYTAGGQGATVSSNPLQSTTGNYYGIYDTVGGCYEYVAGYIADSSTSNGNSFATIEGGTTNNNTKSTEYATVYDMVNEDAIRAENYNLNINKKFGDAIIETSIDGTGATSWNSAYSYFVGVYGTDHCSFFRYGGSYSSTKADLFYFSSYNGNSSGIAGFRLSLIIM